MHILLILHDPPYGSERCYNGLRLADHPLMLEPDRKSCPPSTDWLAERAF